MLCLPTLHLVSVPFYTLSTSAHPIWCLSAPAHLVRAVYILSAHSPSHPALLHYVYTLTPYFHPIWCLCTIHPVWPLCDPTHFLCTIYSLLAYSSFHPGSLHTVDDAKQVCENFCWWGFQACGDECSNSGLVIMPNDWGGQGEVTKSGRWSHSLVNRWVDLCAMYLWSHFTATNVSHSP